MLLTLEQIKTALNAVLTTANINIEKLKLYVDDKLTKNNKETDSKINKVTDTVLNEIVGKKVDAEGAEIFNDYENNVATGDYSHAEGYSTQAQSQYQHVQGKYNVVDANDKYAHILGNGSYNQSSNAHTVDWDGNAWFAGNVKVGGTSYDDASEVALKKDIPTVDTDLSTTSTNSIQNKTITNWLAENVKKYRLRFGTHDNYTSYAYLSDEEVDTTAGEADDGSQEFVIYQLEEGNDIARIGALWEDIKGRPTIPSKTSDLINDSGFLNEKPTYTAAEVGADSKGTASSTVSTHNTSTDAHNDIRLLISDLTTIINTILNSEDVDLDQLSEIVAYIKSNRSLIEQVTTNKINVSDIIDNLTTNVANKPLSAKQGVALKALIDAIKVPTKLSELSADATHRLVTDTEKAAWNAKSNFSGSYNDLTNKPTIPSKTSQLSNDSGYIKKAPVEVAVQSGTPSEGNIWIDIDEDEEITLAEIDDAAVTNDKTWSSNKINEKVEQLNATIPTKTSQLTNDSGFLTKHQSLDGYAKTSNHYTKTESDNKYQSKGNYLTSIPSDVANHKDDMSMHIVYGVCETAADVVDKIVTVDDNFTLKEGATVIIRFINANSIASPTLNVNGTGAKPMYRYGTTTLSTGTTTTGWIAGAIQMFVYDGTGWTRDYWNNTTYSNVSLGHGYTTCSTAASTTAKTAALSSYALTTGGSVSVKFTNAVPAGATLNINSKGAKAIYYRGTAITADVINAGDTATFVYNSQYHLISIDRLPSEPTTETWTFTLADGSTVNKKVVLA